MDTTATGENPNNLRHEYSELCLTIRHYSALRFAILTVFFALTGGLIMVGFGQSQSNQQPSEFIKIATRVGGLVGVFVFWIFEERLIAYMHHFEGIASELEKKLGYRAYSTRPSSKLPFVKTPVATRLLYFAVTVFWILSFFAQ